MSAHNWVAPIYLQAKPKVHVLILGSYEASALRRLKKLRDFLLTKEYLQACLVKEFRHPAKEAQESQSSFNLRKSEYWIPRADVAVFVFLPEVDNTGVGYELKHLCDNHYDMAWRSVVGISTKPAPKTSSLIDGLIQRWSEDIQQVFFDTDQELRSGLIGALTNLLERLYFRIINRPSGEWENSK